MANYNIFYTYSATNGMIYTNVGNDSNYSRQYCYNNMSDEYKEYEYTMIDRFETSSHEAAVDLQRNLMETVKPYVESHAEIRIPGMNAETYKTMVSAVYNQPEKRDMMRNYLLEHYDHRKQGGIIYFILCGDNTIKVGLTNNLERRFSQLQNSKYKAVKILNHLNVKDGGVAEAYFHNLFSQYKKSQHCEWRDNSDYASTGLEETFNLSWKEMCQILLTNKEYICTLI